MTLDLRNVTLQTAIERANELRGRREIQLRHLKETERELQDWAWALTMNWHMTQVRAARECGINRRTLIQWVEWVKQRNGSQANGHTTTPTP